MIKLFVDSGSSIKQEEKATYGVEIFPLQILLGGKNYIDGVDLVTEGVITMNRVIEYAKDYLGDNAMYEHWNFKKDGASLISRLLFEEATDINFYVGRAVNPAHQNPDLPINFNIKMNLVKELSECLRRMGKRIKVSYF